MVNWSKTNVNSNSLAWKNENTGSDIIGYWIKCMHLKGLETCNFSLTDNNLILYFTGQILSLDYFWTFTLPSIGLLRYLISTNFVSFRIRFKTLKVKKHKF